MFWYWVTAMNSISASENSNLSSLGLVVGSSSTRHIDKCGRYLHSVWTNTYKQRNVEGIFSFAISAVVIEEEINLINEIK